MELMLFMLGFLCWCVYMLYLIGKSKVKISGQDWYDNKLKELGIKDTDLVLNNSTNNMTAENSVIYTECDFIYIVNKMKQIVTKVNKVDILKLDVNVYSSERNVKKLIALTSTFDKRVNITGLELIIVTKQNTHTISIMTNGLNVDKVPVFDKKRCIDDVNRFKLILENDIENMKRLNY